MKKLTFFLISLLTVFTACSDGLDNVEYNRNSDIVVATPEATVTTGTSLTVHSSVTGNLNNVAKRGFCYSVNVLTPTIKDNVVEADENFSATISGLTGNTVYYIRSYVYGNSRYTYSETFTVTTAASSLDEQLKNYVAPTYEDYYVDIASWDQRNQWNLANVHDPTVVLAEDGYYYMYQTDASYGNAHTAGGHFHGRRSKDLVNWEYLGGVMPALPEWVIPKLNEAERGFTRNHRFRLLGTLCAQSKKRALSYVLLHCVPRYFRWSELLGRTRLHRSIGELKPRQQQRLGR